LAAQQQELYWIKYRQNLSETHHFHRHSIFKGHIQSVSKRELQFWPRGRRTYQKATPLLRCSNISIFKGTHQKCARQRAAFLKGHIKSVPDKELRFWLKGGTTWFLIKWKTIGTSLEFFFFLLFISLKVREFCSSPS